MKVLTKILFLTLLLCQPAVMWAQPSPDIPALPTKVTSIDTIALPKGYKIKNPHFASKLPKPHPLDFRPEVMKPVPKAGDQEVFGEMTEYVTDYVRKYFRSHNKTLDIVRQRSQNQFPLIDHILNQYDIPKELKYLSVIESALNNKALSGVGAYGPWQFMSGTAQMLGLHVTAKRDERADWFKSTTAAAKYLTILYEEFNDWFLVVAAYNCGPVPVNRAIRRTGKHDFWSLKPYLPRETQGHVLAFIATTTIFENLNYLIGKNIPNDYDITGKRKANVSDAVAPVVPRFTREELEMMAVIKTKDVINLDLMCHELGLDKKLLDKWNDDYDLFITGTYSEDAYMLRFPKAKLDKFLERRNYLISQSKKMFSEMAL